MRPIKFRQRINGKWHFWGIVDGGFIAPVNPKEQSYQFIGIYDENGKEIYEGDIIRSASKSIGVVKYGGLCFYFEGKQPNGSQYWETITNPCISQDDCKVIGNIYENPDLLKKTAGDK